MYFYQLLLLLQLLPTFISYFLPTFTTFTHTHTHSTMEDGLLPALTYRYTARLHATFSLLTLSLSTHSDDDKTLVDLLQGKLTVLCRIYKMSAVFVTG